MSVKVSKAAQKTHKRLLEDYMMGRDILKWYKRDIKRKIYPYERKKHKQLWRFYYRAKKAFYQQVPHRLQQSLLDKW